MHDKYEAKMSEIKIIHTPTKQKPYLVIYKPKGLPSAPLFENDKENAFSQAARIFPELLKVHSKKEIEHGLLHRLDTATDGLLVIAAEQDCYDFLLEEQKQGRFIKKYFAECEIIDDNSKRLGGFPPVITMVNLNNQSPFTVSSYFRFYGERRKEVRPVTENSGKAALSKLGKEKLYNTKIEIQRIENNKAFINCQITQGFKHQVRCHLAWAGLPVINDMLYNSNFRIEYNNMSDSDKKNAENMLKFSATSVSFEYPRGDLNSYDRKDTWT